MYFIGLYLRIIRLLAVWPSSLFPNQNIAISKSVSILGFYTFAGVSLLNETLVAIKFEPRKTDAPQLRDEYRTYKLLAGSGWFHAAFLSSILNALAHSIVGIPNVYFFGQEGLHNILVIDLLGHSMEDLFDCCNRKFSFKCTAMVAKQMVMTTTLNLIFLYNLAEHILERV